MNEQLRGSLRLRLALRFGVAFLALLSACAFYLHLRLGGIFQKDVDSELRRAATVVAQRLDEETEPPDRELLEVEGRVLIRITDQDGRVLIQSDGMAQSVPMGLFPSGEPFGVITDRRNSSGDQIRFLVKRYGHGHVFAARDMRHEVRLLRQFMKALALTVLLGTFAASLLGLSLARRGLQPLERFAAQAAAIGPENLHLRLDSQAIPAELVALAESLNHAFARLEKAFSRLSGLNADLAHELRTPLQALRLETESLAQNPHRPDLEDRLGDMAAGLDQVLALSEQMLLLAKTEDPATQIQKVELDPIPFMEAALAPFEALAAEKDIILRTHIVSSSRLWAEPMLATRAIRNLVSNALCFAPEGSSIFISLDQEGAEQVLRVSDEGPGISSDLLARVGQRFIRPDTARTKEQGGSGLGLAIVQGIMTLHGGQLSLQSRSGLGTQAVLRFPPT